MMSWEGLPDLSDYLFLTDVDQGCHHQISGHLHHLAVDLLLQWIEGHHLHMTDCEDHLVIECPRHQICFLLIHVGLHHPTVILPHHPGNHQVVGMIMVYLVIYLLYRCMVLLNERACHVITKEKVLLRLIIMILQLYSFIMFGITDLRITYYKLQYKNMSNVLNS